MKFRHRLRLRGARGLILGCLVLVFAQGCIAIHTDPSRNVSVELLDSQNQPVPEWWVVTWREKRKCDFGVVATLHGLMLIPESSSIDSVRLYHMRPGQNVMKWPGSYQVYLCYFLLLLPPAGGWEGWGHFAVVAPGVKGDWVCQGGLEYPWEIRHDEQSGTWNVLARCLSDRSSSDSGGRRLPMSVPPSVLTQLANSPDVPDEEWKAFVTAVKNGRNAR